MSDKKSKILVASIVSGVIIFIIFLLFARTTPDNCKFLEQKPLINNNTKLLNTASPDFKTLVNMAGYIEYLNNTNTTGYVGLSLHRVHHNASSIPETLTIKAQCATITLSISKGLNQWSKVDKMSLELLKPNNETRFCEILPNITVPAKKHYKCYSDKTYDCVAEKGLEQKTIAKLVLQRFEFELETQESDAKNAVFSTPEELCQ